MFRSTPDDNQTIIERLVAQQANIGQNFKRDDRQTVLERLVAQQTEISQICKLSGIAGASVVVLHYGEEIYQHHYGYQDVEAKQEADGDTLYGIGSCSMSFFSVAVSSLVAQAKLSWTDPVRNILPQLGTASDTVNKYCNLIDLLAHRLGLANAWDLTFQGDGDHLIGEKDFWTYLPRLKPIFSFREKWLFNKHGYSLVGEMIKKVTGKSVNECLQSEVCKPLGLTRTTTQLDFDETSNFAKPYAALTDGTPYLLQSRQDFRNHFFEVSSGVYTTPNDASKFAKELLSALSGAHLGRRSIVKEIETMFMQHIPIAGSALLERSYACGWIRTQLPGITGIMGNIVSLLPGKELPNMGNGPTSRLVLYHQGPTVGYFTSFYLFPQTNSAVLTLSNSIALGDTPDWIAQAVTQALFDDPVKVDWTGLTKRAMVTLWRSYHKMSETLDSERAPGTTRRKLAEYAGKYYDVTGVFYIQVEPKAESESDLTMSFQGLERHSFNLRHLRYDVFEWALTQNEAAKRARNHQIDPEYFKMTFWGPTSISMLSWRHSPRLGLETFEKRNY